MQTTTRVHMNPKEALGSLEHVRCKDFRDRESHVDEKDGRFEVWHDKSVYDVYDEIFGEAVRAYNAKQKRKDRKILDSGGDAVGGYIQTIQDGRRGKRERAVYKTTKDGSKEVVGKRQESQGQRVLYELVVSAGNCEKARDDNGSVVYTDDGHEVQPMRVPYEVNRAAIKSFFEQFETFYPQFRLTTVAFHGDEFYYNAHGVKEYGIEHGHGCFVPFADGYKRGLPVQASVTKALEQMGFKNGEDVDGVWHNAYWYFTQDAQARFEDILQREYNMYYGNQAEPLEFVHPARGQNRLNLDPATYRGLKDVERRVNLEEEKLRDLQRKTAEEQNKRIRAETDAINAEIRRKEAEAYEQAVIEYAREVGEREKVVAEREAEIDTHYRQRLDAADTYYKQKRDAAEMYYTQRCGDADKYVADIIAQYDDIADTLDTYKEQCEEVIKGGMCLWVPDKRIKMWMQDKKVVRNGVRMSVYDACLRDVEPEGKARARAHLAAANTLMDDVARQRLNAEVLMPMSAVHKCDTEDEFDL